MGLSAISKAESFESVLSCIPKLFRWISSGWCPTTSYYAVVQSLRAHTTRPTCILSALNPPTLPSDLATEASFTLTYLGETLEAVPCSTNVALVPQRTFADIMAPHSTQGTDSGCGIDVLLLPGGLGARPWNASDALKAFVKWAGQNVEYVLTVCTGSWLLAHVGGLDGQRATTNKKAFLKCKEDNASRSVEWMAKARFVRSGKFWTASGVSAGTDMACAFVDEVCGQAAGQWAREYAEYTSAGEGDDPWAEKCGLV